MKYILTIGILSMILAGCSTLPATEPTVVDPTTEVVTETSETETEETLTEGEAMYKPYSSAEFENMTGKPFAVFFHAGWCPKCQALEANINKVLSSLPESFRVLKADFDKETELKAKYGVTMQTTFIIIDANGEAVETLANPSLEQITNSLEKA